MYIIIHTYMRCSLLHGLRRKLTHLVFRELVLAMTWPQEKKNVRSCQVRMNHTTTKNLILKPFQMSLRHPYDSKVGKKKHAYAG